MSLSTNEQQENLNFKNILTYLYLLQQSVYNNVTELFTSSCPINTVTSKTVGSTTTNVFVEITFVSNIKRHFSSCCNHLCVRLCVSRLYSPSVSRSRGFTSLYWWVASPTALTEEAESCREMDFCCFIDSWLRFLFFYILLRCYCVLHLLFVEFHFMSVFTPIKNNIKTSITVCIIGHLPLCTNTWWFSAGVPSSYCVTWMNLIFLYL